MVKLSFYVPATHLEAVKHALFAVGAGKIGQYEQCCWQTKGQGQFRPMAGSQPAVGSTNELCQLEEFLVEMVCETAKMEAIIDALKRAHPYEEPAFGAWPLQWA